MRSLSIRFKMVAVTALCVAVATAGVIWVLQAAHERGVEASAERAVKAASDGFRNLEELSTQKLGAALAVALNCDHLSEAYLARDREGLQELSLPIFEELRNEFGVTHWYFEGVETSPTVFLRVHKPDVYGDLLERATYTEAVRSQTFAAGLELGVTAYALRVVHPYKDRDGSLIGYMEMGEEIEAFLDILQRQTGDEYALLIEKSAIEREDWREMRAQRGAPDNWDEFTEYVVAGSTEGWSAAWELEKAPSALPDEGEVVGVVEARTDHVVRGAFPVVDATGRKQGVVLVERDISEAVGVYGQTRRNALIVAVSLFVVLSMLIVLMMNRLVFARLQDMVDHMEHAATQLAGGDYDVELPPAKLDDEIGRFERFFGEFVRLIGRAIRELMSR